MKRLLPLATFLFALLTMPMTANAADEFTEARVFPGIRAETVDMNMYSAVASDGQNITVFHRSPGSFGSWSIEAEFEAPLQPDKFGPSSIAINRDGTMILLGLPDHTVGHSSAEAGVVAVLEKGPDGEWAKTDSLTLEYSDRQGSDDHFGEALTLAGDALAVWAKFGQIDFFRLGSDGKWARESKLTREDEEPVWNYHRDMEFDGQTLVVRASGELSWGNAPPLYSIYTQSGSGEWMYDQTIDLGNRSGKESAYPDMSLDGDRLAIGTGSGIVGEGEPDSLGVVYICEKSATGWAVVDSITEASLDIELKNNFGVGVALTGDILVVANNYWYWETPDQSHGIQEQTFYTFQKGSSGWELTQVFGEGNKYDEYYRDDPLAISGRRFILGLEDARSGPDEELGCVKFYELPALPLTTIDAGVAGKVTVDGATYPSPVYMEWESGTEHRISVPTSVRAGDRTWWKETDDGSSGREEVPLDLTLQFAGWSDGTSTATMEYTARSSSTTLSAEYEYADWEDWRPYMGGELGYEVESGGNLVMMGSPGRNRVQVFLRTDDAPMQLHQTLTGSDGFGAEICMGGPYVAIGCRDASEVHFYEYNDDLTLSKASTMTGDEASGGNGSGGFGLNIAWGQGGSSSTSVFVIGAPNMDGGKGAAYVVSVDENGPSVTETLEVTDLEAGDFFGTSVASYYTDGGGYLVGASGFGTLSADDAGAVFVFDTDGSWIGRINDRNGTEGARFGDQIATDHHNALVVIGAPRQTMDTYPDEFGPAVPVESGKVYVYQATGSSSPWEKTAEFLPPDSTTGSRFGHSVAVHNDLIAVGAPYDTSLYGEEGGAVYTFAPRSDGSTSEPGEWIPMKRLVPESGSSGEQFGWSVSASVSYIEDYGVQLVVGSKGSNGSRFLVADYDDVTGIKDVRPTSATELAGNYPNPFNPSTSIVYHMQAAGQMELSIYNIAGQKIRTLVQGWQPAGTREVAWDGRDAVGRNMASGVYMIRMTTGDFQSVKRMTLVR